MDNRVLNNMRQTMNESIEDERGLMSKVDFKQMFFTSFGRAAEENKKVIYDMLIPIIETDKPIFSKNNSEVTSVVGDGNATGGEYVSIGKLSLFIDFFNYVPFMI